MSSSDETQPLTFVLNGQPVAVQARPGARLLDVLRESGAGGVKEGCGDGSCGACTVLLDGEAVCACLTLAQSVEGQAVITVEGLAAAMPQVTRELHAAFTRASATQCGFCTPGMLLTAAWLLQRNPRPTGEQVRQALGGNLCRCTGYASIVRAVLEAANVLRTVLGERTETLDRSIVDDALRKGAP